MVQIHENDKAEMVIVCSPSLSKMMGALHPAGALYEKPVNLERSHKAHEDFVSLLRRRGVQVEDVRQVLARDVERDVGERVKLEKLAAQCLTYDYDGGEDGGDGGFYLGETYKMSVIEAMSKWQLVDIIMTIPTVTIKRSLRDTGFTASYRFEPLSNIIFARDQQVTTAKGIVMARLSSPQRQREVDVMEFVFKKLGLDVVDRIPEPGHLEGGDFFPAGKDLCFIGVGARTDTAAVQYMLKKNLFGTRRVAVVYDRLEKEQTRMHLDTVFNILSDKCVLMLKDMMGQDSKTKRVVDEYVSDGSKYMLKRGDIEFSKYVNGEGYEIIEIPGEDQLKYGCNVLNLGRGSIVSIEKKSARRIAQAECFNGTVEYLDFSAVTTMYGGVHCASQVVRRSESAENGQSENQFH
eukprot:Plantae.Rhodophyta-Hildenbrandia_rubra.ctg2512.p1 GENE.Plantae.Rhodophyta-Hildenbrandia_rubra.ctg2512~~Plantae.Rhodophyta-Hildenbrandia_rubra.ctg2512.p1  ORF type:complete len:407 (+),score=91.77 Plantae.Rhodophyta-Hildenbrandia_rubra.ctg2512:301-1521(+)